MGNKERFEMQSSPFLLSQDTHEHTACFHFPLILNPIQSRNPAKKPPHAHSGISSSLPQTPCGGAGSAGAPGCLCHLLARPKMLKKLNRRQ